MRDGFINKGISSSIAIFYQWMDVSRNLFIPGDFIRLNPPLLLSLVDSLSRVEHSMQQPPPLYVPGANLRSEPSLRVGPLFFASGEKK